MPVYFSIQLENRFFCGNRGLFLKGSKMLVLKALQAGKGLPGTATLVGLFLIFAMFSSAASLAEPEAGKADVAVKTNFLFIHHSCGGMLMADPGSQVGGEKGSGNWCNFEAHPNGGGLRSRLESQGYQVNELTYESRLGEDTDIQHWRAKFSDHMDDLLQTANQDDFLPVGQRNSIVAFKSCYPNNRFVGMGDEPGDPDSPVRTIANGKAAYNSLLPVFEQNPQVLFVAFTAPARAEPKPVGIKAKLKALFRGKPKDADLARGFNDWLADPAAGWLAGYSLKNVVVFDYYDVLTEGGKSNWSRFATRDGRDSHPSREGNALAAEVFVPFLAESVMQWGGQR